MLAGPISHTSIQHMNFVEILNVSLDLSTIILLILVGVKLPLYIVVLVVTLSKNAITCLTCFLE